MVPRSERGNEMNAKPIIGRGWMQEWHDAGSPNIRVRAKSLRKAGLVVHTDTSLQITEVGRCKMTLLDARTADGSGFTDDQFDVITAADRMHDAAAAGY